MAKSFFRTDSSQGQTEFEPIPEGVYEMIISDIEIKTFGSGNKGISAKYTVRDDVDQPAKKRVVFDTFVATEKAMFKFHQIASVFPELDGKDFTDADHLLREFAKVMKGKPIKVRIDHDPSRDKYIERVKGISKSTLAAGGSGTNPFAGEGKVIDISDDDLPF